MQINYTIPLFLFLSLMQPMCADTSFSLDSQEGKKWQFTEADVQVHDYQEYSQEQKTSEIWQECEVPGNMSDYLSKAESGKSHEFWLKKVFELPNRLENKQLSIRLGIISDKDKTYLNGELIGSHGNFSNSKPEFYDKVRVYKVPSHLLRKGKNVILVHIKGFFTYETGIVQDKTEIGETDQVFTSFATESCLQLLLYAMYTTSGLYFLFLFLNRKKEKEYLYFALLTFCLSLYQFLRTQLKYELDIELLWLKKAEYMILATLVPFYANFIREFLGFRLTLLYKILNVGFTLLAIYFLLETRIFYFDKVNQYILQPLWFPYILSSIYYLVKRLQQGNREPLFIFAGMLFLLAATLTDIFSNRGFFVMPRTIPTGFACFVFSMALVLARKYVKLNMEIEELNSNLERKVCERTLELKQALEEVTGLK
ncbi:MAG: 7TM diverse intracellular signaling domain-containing protein, partial [Spirochaetota bacterium]